MVQASIMGARVKIYFRPCWVGGKLRGSNGQRKAQLESSRVGRVEMLVVYKHFIALLSLSRDWKWRPRARILFFSRLMIHM